MPPTRFSVHPTRHARAHTGTIGQTRIPRPTLDGPPSGTDAKQTGTPIPSPPARRPAETTGPTGARRGVTASWHGPHLVGVRTCNAQRTSYRGCGNPRPQPRPTAEVGGEDVQFSHTTCRQVLTMTQAVSAILRPCPELNRDRSCSLSGKFGQETTSHLAPPVLRDQMACADHRSLLSL